MGAAPAFRRGFVDSVTMYPKRFVAEGAGLFAVVPARRVRFTDLKSVRGGLPVGDLVAGPNVSRLAGIDFELSQLTDADLEALAAAPALRGLRSLRLNAAGLDGRAGVRALMRSPHLANLCDLEFRLAGDGEVAALAAEPGFRRIRRLAVWEAHVGPTGAKALAKSPHAAGLVHLEFGAMGGQRLGVEGTAALASSKHLANLRTLRLSSEGVGLGGVKAIAASAHLGNLRRLNLSGNSFTPAMVAALAASRAMPHLESLELTVTDDEEDALRRAYPAAAIGLR